MNTRGGAHLVVHDRPELVLKTTAVRLSSMRALPDAWERREALRQRLEHRPLMVFLDYDGTLTPIVADRNRALLSDAMRAAIAAVADIHPTTVISGRDLENIRGLVGLDSIFYAGSHGFEIAGPGGWRHTVEKATEFLPDLDQAESALRERLSDIPGHDVERKAFDIAVHYRQVTDGDLPRLERVLHRILEHHPSLRTVPGKRVFQVQPRTDWNKGRALRWILEHAELPGRVQPVYIGDDVTDEDGFRAVQSDGVGVVVLDDPPRMTTASYVIEDVAAVQRLLEWLPELTGERW